ncbi:hypothetical protein QI334_13320 [Staphylococcus saprophyticus]|uniref:hypothetical protein n=1 Tax=Staphylococcus saprophyticus TaxID=29385 RepID=UPI00119D206B|nr:hypothetical protein [Staphylococcus saprophyticus]MDW3916017.1 hypothetical protein [Staphylococcus saprophyticus]MDW3930638.1 hypothetical protein [Staphylococcus saprophyticus]MDW3935966.1 hypothetical protein [Staphylococcus saprophyticus]MDW3998614.1 hypothetical protein [Staphylococcus saprophyticus]MDW4011243.1 hypothetical protein [Staphylococcus saprophyticus]
MTQGLIAGMTPYEDQSLKDIQIDINKWQAYTNMNKTFFEETLETLDKRDYLKVIDYDVLSIFRNTIQITETFLEDFNKINQDISNGHITQIDVKLLKNIGDVSYKNNVKYAKTYKANDYWHDYNDMNPNSSFRLAESLYQKGRDFFATLEDAANASPRLEHYINPNNTNNTTFVVNGTGNNIQQNLSGNMTMNIQQNNTKNADEIEKLINEILENLDTYFTEEETKTEIKELIEVIQNETKQEKPKKSMIKTALKGLQTFNESTQFISTIAQLTQTFGFLPPN